MLGKLLSVDFDLWSRTLEDFRVRVVSLKVPSVNTPDTLQRFNVETEELYSEIQMWYAISRANRDAIQRLIKNVLDNAYQGKNEMMRRAAGIQRAENFPYNSINVNLFDLEYTFNEYFYLLDSMVKSIEAKMNAKITNNSLLNLEKDLMPNI